MNRETNSIEQGKLSPQNAKTLDEICSLESDNFGGKNYWILLEQDDTVSIKRDNLGGVEGCISIPKNEFDKIIKWYTREQNVTSERGNRRRAGNKKLSPKNNTFKKGVYMKKIELDIDQLKSDFDSSIFISQVKPVYEGRLRNGKKFQVQINITTEEGEFMKMPASPNPINEHS